MPGEAQQQAVEGRRAAHELDLPVRQPPRPILAQQLLLGYTDEGALSSGPISTPQLADERSPVTGQRRPVADAAPSGRSERLVIRGIEGPEPWLDEWAEALRRLPELEVVAWVRLGTRAPLPYGRPRIDELATCAPTRLHRDAVTLLNDLSERSLPPGLEAMRRWMPVFGEPAPPPFSFAGSLPDNHGAVLARFVEVTGTKTGRVLEEGRLRPVPHSPKATHARLRSVVARWPARVLGRMRAGCSGPLTTVALGADSDFTSIAKVIEEWAGVEIRG